ncbi:hypothetical protein [Aquidulcibacter sp.]|uniref:hypothetical protein n=1 Tax=Aquidulcibacter sp. TaxID=2052990 RepID=UPI0025C0EF29|nr:hypothetical protein [Aquidulcibacter sp.]MCA3697459.1 hypothetical protein [Aquidulcibacter sp.]
MSLKPKRGFFTINLVGFGFAAALLIWLAMMPERQRMDLFGSGSAIYTGEKFGLNVGMDANLARTKLEQTGYTWSSLNDVPSIKNCRYIATSLKYDSLAIFSDERWGGVVCLNILDDKIVAISWSYGGWEF